MKKALVSYLEERIYQIVNVGEVFDVAPPLQWVDCEDTVTVEDYLYVANQIQLKPQETIAGLKAAKIQAVKDYRDTLIIQGGHKIGNYWYHSNEISLIQQLALNGVANQMIAAGANDSQTLAGVPPWKTMSGEKVTLTVGIAKNFIASGFTQQGALFAHAETKIAEIEALPSRQSIKDYDPTSGFPETYTGG